MKKIILLISITMCGLLVQCDNDNPSIGKVELKFEASFPTPISVAPFTNSQTLINVENHYQKSLKNSNAEGISNPLHSVSFDFTKGHVLEFNGGLKDRALVVHSPNTSNNVQYDFITYLNENGKPYDLSLIRKVTFIDGMSHFRLEFFNASHELIDGIEVEDGKSQRLTKNSSAARSWGACVQGKFEDMSDGSTLGSAVGLTCMVLGWECAASIAAGCLVSSWIF